METEDLLFSKDTGSNDWIQKANEERKSAFETINSELSSFTDSQKLGAYLGVQSNLYHYSVSNAVLVASKLPSATYLQTAKQWHDQGKFVKKGETGITILEAGKAYEKTDGTKAVSFKPRKVFDITQIVDGKAVARRTLEPKTVIKALIATSPVPVVINNDVQHSSGGFYNPIERQIEIKQGMDFDQIFRAVASEIVHARADGEIYDRAATEPKATCVTYMMCKRNGIIPPSLKDASKKFEGLEGKDVRAVLEVFRSEYNEMAKALAKELTPPGKEVKSHERS